MVNISNFGPLGIFNNHTFKNNYVCNQQVRRKLKIPKRLSGETTKWVNHKISPFVLLTVCPLPLFHLKGKRKDNTIVVNSVLTKFAVCDLP